MLVLLLPGMPLPGMLLPGMLLLLLVMLVLGRLMLWHGLLMLQRRWQRNREKQKGKRERERERAKEQRAQTGQGAFRLGKQLPGLGDEPVRICQKHSCSNP